MEWVSNDNNKTTDEEILTFALFDHLFTALYPSVLSFAKKNLISHQQLSKQRNGFE